MNLSQGENGVLAPGLTGASSHEGTMAIDCYGKDQNQDPCYAPCTMKCIYKDSFEHGNACFFESTSEVLLANGEKSIVSMLFIHDNDISDISINTPINQGALFFHEGTAGEASGNHVHIEVKKGKIPTDASHYPYELNSKGRYMIPDPMHTWDAFYINYTSIGYAFNYNFKIYNYEPFNPIGKSNGEHEYNGNYYYVENQIVIKGWKEINGKWKYYDLSDGHRINNSWIESNSKYYYMGSDGYMLTDSWLNTSGSHWFYLDTSGVMAVGWKNIKQSNTSTIKKYFYFNPKDDTKQTAGYPYFPDFQHGEMVRSQWIAGSGGWSYVLAGGAMVSNAQTNIDGKWYKFDSSGYCLDKNGSFSKYPNIPEV